MTKIKILPHINPSCWKHCYPSNPTESWVQGRHASCMGFEHVPLGLRPLCYTWRQNELIIFILCIYIFICVIICLYMQSSDFQLVHLSFSQSFQMYCFIFHCLSFCLYFPCQSLRLSIFRTIWPCKNTSLLTYA